MEEDRLIERELGEYALLAREPGDKQYEESTYLADTGASMHMTGNPEGLFDCKDINEPVILGSGKHLVATKIGKVRKTVLQQDGSTQDILLDPIKYVPGLELQLFAVLKALEQGRKLDNNGVKLVLTKGKV